MYLIQRRLFTSSIRALNKEPSKLFIGKVLEQLVTESKKNNNDEKNKFVELMASCKDPKVSTLTVLSQISKVLLDGRLIEKNAAIHAQNKLIEQFSDTNELFGSNLRLVNNLIKLNSPISVKALNNLILINSERVLSNWELLLNQLEVGGEYDDMALSCMIEKLLEKINPQAQDNFEENWNNIVKLVILVKNISESGKEKILSKDVKGNIFNVLIETNCTTLLKECVDTIGIKLKDDYDNYSLAQSFLILNLKNPKTCCRFLELMNKNEDSLLEDEGDIVRIKYNQNEILVQENLEKEYNRIMRLFDNKKLQETGFTFDIRIDDKSVTVEKETFIKKTKEIVSKNDNSSEIIIGLLKLYKFYNYNEYELISNEYSKKKEIQEMIKFEKLKHRYVYEIEDIKSKEIIDITIDNEIGIKYENDINCLKMLINGYNKKIDSSISIYNEMMNKLGEDENEKEIIDKITRSLVMSTILNEDLELCQYLMENVTQRRELISKKVSKDIKMILSEYGNVKDDKDKRQEYCKEVLISSIKGLNKS